MISKPGLHLNVSSTDYFADPAPKPSLTQSIAKIILNKSPLHAWHAHPRLNPDFQPDDSTKYDVGNIAHRLLIGRGKELVVLDFDDWRTGPARSARHDAAHLDGKLAVLRKHYQLGERMVMAAREQFELRGLGDLFTVGNGEVMALWKEGDVWLRQLIDWIDNQRTVIVDYKTTDESAAPHAVARKMANDGWHIQAAMASRGLDHTVRFEYRTCLFVVQETQAPYSLSVVELNREALTMGRKMLDVAFNIWRQCLAENRWPGYPLQNIVPEFPAWAEAQWLDREQTEFVNVLAAG